jgi:hypothetical protein
MTIPSDPSILTYLRDGSLGADGSPSHVERCAYVGGFPLTAGRLWSSVLASPSGELRKTL